MYFIGPFSIARRACEYILVLTQFHGIVKSRLHPIYRPRYYCMLLLANQLWGHIYIYMLLYIKSHHMHARYWEKTCSLAIINNPRLFQLVKQISTCINLGGLTYFHGKIWETHHLGYRVKFNWCLIPLQKDGLVQRMKKKT
jgi:hypothetical protein